MHRSSTAAALGPPLAAWVLAAAAVLGASAWAGASPWDAQTWTHGDSFLYLDIARHGFTLYRCGADWCGNAGWFPALPWLTAAVHAVTRVSYVGAAVGVASAFHAATLVLLWNTFLERRLTVGAVSSLLFAAFAPGLVFHEAIFPMSVLAFFTLLHLWLLYRRRWLGAGLAGAAAALAYPVGVLLAGTSALWLLVRGAPAGARVRAVAEASGLTLAGALVFLVDQRLETGRWNAYFLVQRKYDHALEEPFAPLENALHILRHHSPFAVTTPITSQVHFAVSSATADETVLVAALLACGLASVLLRRPVDDLGLLLVIWAVAAYIVPQLETEVQSYRVEATLLPLALFLPRLPRPLAVLFAVLTICLSVPIARLAFEGRLF